MQSSMMAAPVNANSRAAHLALFPEGEHDENVGNSTHQCQQQGLPRPASD